MIRVHVTVGAGGWSFCDELDLPAVPRSGPDGDDIGFSNGPTYRVSSVTITPLKVYVRCHRRFLSEEDARSAGEEWLEAKKNEG